MDMTFIKSIGGSVAVHLLAAGILLIFGAMVSRQPEWIMVDLRSSGGGEVKGDSENQPVHHAESQPTRKRDVSTPKKEVSPAQNPLVSNDLKDQPRDLAETQVSADVEQETTEADFAGVDSNTGSTNARSDYIGPGNGGDPRFDFIRKLIQGRLNYPGIARKLGWSGKVIVSFRLLADGTVQDVRVVQGSGYPVLDQNAVDTVRGIGRFEGAQSETNVIIPIVYQLT